MVGRQALNTRVSTETKRRVTDASARQLVKPSVWLRRVVADALGPGPSADAQPAPVERSVERTTHRLCARIRPSDAALLRARAAERGMQPSTYVSVLIRSHLRTLSPLPKREIFALRRAVSQLGAITRNLSGAADSDDGAVLRGQDFRTVQRVCQALREDIKTILKANAAGWAAGGSTTGHDRPQAPKRENSSKFGRRTPATTNIRSRRHYPNSEPNIRNSEH
jgi:hypothetical protein